MTETRQEKALVLAQQALDLIGDPAAWESGKARIGLKVNLLADHALRAIERILEVQP